MSPVLQKPDEIFFVACFPFSPILNFHRETNHFDIEAIQLWKRAEYRVATLEEDGNSRNSI